MKNRHLKKYLIPNKIISLMKILVGFILALFIYKIFALHLLYSDEISPFWNHTGDETNIATILCLLEMLLSTFELSEHHLL